MLITPFKVSNFQGIFISILLAFMGFLMKFSQKLYKQYCDPVRGRSPPGRA